MSNMHRKRLVTRRMNQCFQILWTSVLYLVKYEMFTGPTSIPLKKKTQYEIIVETTIFAFLFLSNDSISKIKFSS